MPCSRNMRNFGNGKTLNDFTIRNLSRETAEVANRGDAMAFKLQSALHDFGSHLKENFGIRYLEKVNINHVQSWAESLNTRLIEGELSSSTTSSYVSAINSMFSLHDRYDLRISAKEFEIARGCKYSNENLANSEFAQKAFLDWCMNRYQNTDDIRYKALYHSATIQSQAGLRFRESTQIKIQDKDLGEQKLNLTRSDGVKNGQPRIFNPLNMEGLKRSQDFVIRHNDVFSKGSLIPANMNYKQYKAWAYKQLGYFRSEQPMHSKYGFHGNRHGFAHKTYENCWLQKVGERIQAPVVKGMCGSAHIIDIIEKTGFCRDLAHKQDQLVNLTVAEALGHHRVDSGYHYNGK